MPQFVAGKKLKKREFVEKIRDLEASFITAIHQFALSERWPWDDPEVRNGSDELIDPDRGLLDL